MASSVDRISGGAFGELKVIEGVGNLKLLQKLQSALTNIPFAFCGTPGTGEKHLLTMAAAKAEFALLIYDMSHIANGNGVRVNDLATVLNRFGGNGSLYGKKTLLALYGAEHLDSEGAAML